MLSSRHVLSPHSTQHVLCCWRTSVLASLDSPTTAIAPNLLQNPTLARFRSTGQRTGNEEIVLYRAHYHSTSYQFRRHETAQRVCRALTTLLIHKSSNIVVYFGRTDHWDLAESMLVERNFVSLIFPSLLQPVDGDSGTCTQTLTMKTASSLSPSVLLA